MKTQPTQLEALKEMLMAKLEVNGSTVYKYTKKVSGRGSLNHHKLIGRLRDKGFVIDEKWEGNHEYKSFKLNFKLTPKALLKR